MYKQWRLNIMASRTRRFFLNGISLTLTALLMRGIGMLFSAYVSNHAGSETMGLYSLLGSVYAFSITVATAGINLGTTRLVSEALGLGDNSLAKRAAKRALICCTVTGCIATILLFALAPSLGKHLLGDMRAVRPLKLLALTLIPIAICSCLSGYFTAVRRVKVNAAFQIFSQFAKIGATVILLPKAVTKGPEQACIALVCGGAVAEFISLVITYLLYRIDLRNLKSEKSNNNRQTTHLTKKLLGITLPVTFSACIRSALSMLQHVLVPKGLRASGRTWESALSSYGALHGMAMPLILFPSAIVQSFAGLLIPEVSECCICKDEDRLERVAFRTLSLSLFFSIGVSGIMLFFSHELGSLVYNNDETALYIKIIAPLIPVMYIDSAVDAILKGAGKQVYSMNVNIIDTLTACVFALTLIPKLGIWGYVISIYATEILNTALSLCKMVSVSKIRVKLIHQIILPILCIIGATNGSKIILRLLNLNPSSGLLLTVGILLTIALYIILLLITKTVGSEEKEFLYAAFLSEKNYDKKFKSEIQ